MNAFSIISLIEPLRYQGMRAAETGHALYVLKTGLYYNVGVFYADTGMGTAHNSITNAVHERRQ